MLYLGIEIKDLSEAKTLRNKVFKRTVRDCGQQPNRFPYLKNETILSCKKMLRRLRNWEREAYKRAGKTPPNKLP